MYYLLLSTLIFGKELISYWSPQKGVYISCTYSPVFIGGVCLIIIRSFHEPQPLLLHTWTIIKTKNKTTSILGQNYIIPNPAAHENLARLSAWGRGDSMKCWMNHSSSSPPLGFLFSTVNMWNLHRPPPAWKSWSFQYSPLGPAYHVQSKKWNKRIQRKWKASSSSPQN